MPDIKDQIAQFEKKSIESDTSKHEDKSVQQNSGAGTRVQETQAPSHTEQSLSERPVQASSGRPLSAPPTFVKTIRDQAAIEALYQAAEKEYSAKNFQKAESLYTEVAEAGHIKASLILARAYHSGIRFGKNPEKAFFFAKMAADSGDANGLEILAKYYKDGIGVEQNYAKARDYYKQAVAAGHSVDQIIFDELDCEGFTDYEKGERFEKLAEERLKAGSQNVESYLVNAVDFYKAAFGVPGAKEKAADMTFRMGELYENGIGGREVDLWVALLFYQGALEEGSSLAKAKLADIERLLRESYESEEDIASELTQQPLVSYIKEKCATVDDAIKILYLEMGIPFIDQNSLLVSFSRFLNQLAVLSPNSYSQAEIDRIGTEMGRGHCNGFSLYYVILALSLNDGKVQDNTKKYAEFMTEICNWDRPLFEPPSGFSYNKFRAGDKQGLTEDEIERLAFTDKFKTLVQMIRYGQQRFSEIEEMNKGAKEGESLKSDQQNIQLLLGDEFVSRIHISRPSVPLREALHNSISLMELALTESNVGLLIYSTNPSSSHIVSITFRDGKYFFFDSNHRGVERNYDRRHSAIACDTLDKVIDLITKEYKIDETLQGYVSLKVIERNDVKG